MKRVLVLSAMRLCMRRFRVRVLPALSSLPLSTPFVFLFLFLSVALVGLFEESEREGPFLC